jgi:hypothetical protein
MSAALSVMRDLIQEDINNRGLRTDPVDNLITACPDDFAAACRSIAETPRAAVAVVTGFWIPTATPPGPETDGPLGALFLARALTPLGIRVALLTDGFCKQALQVGLDACGLGNNVLLRTLPPATHPWAAYLAVDWHHFVCDGFRPTHLIALERVGPNHTLASIQAQHGGGESERDFLREVPAEHRDRCHTMRGLDITTQMSPAHLLFEALQGPPEVTTIGIGDGGNEIGMGKLTWDLIRRNIPRGGLVACRVPTDHLIVCGVSNWGGYALGAGVRLLRGAAPDAELFDPERERALLDVMVRDGSLVDGVSGRQTATVDGLTFERYVEPLRRLASIN